MDTPRQFYEKLQQNEAEQYTFSSVHTPTQLHPSTIPKQELQHEEEDIFESTNDDIDAIASHPNNSTTMDHSQYSQIQRLLKKQQLVKQETEPGSVSLTMTPIIDPAPALTSSPEQRKRKAEDTDLPPSKVPKVNPTAGPSASVTSKPASGLKRFF